MSTPSDDDFDNDALQESLGHSLAGASPMLQPGLVQSLLGGGGAAPPQECVDVYSFPGEGLNLFGHIGFSKDGGPIYGKGPQSGYDAQSLVETVPGHIEQVSPGRKPTDHVQICAAPARIESAYQYWLDPNHSRDYSAMGNNCSTLIPAGLRRSGLPAPAGSVVFPVDLMGALHALYDGTQPHHLVDTRPQLPKY